MPEETNQDRRKHPTVLLKFRGTDREAVGAERASEAPRVDRGRYAELVCASNFSFLRGASHAEELVDRAAELGYAALAVTDRWLIIGFSPHAVRQNIAILDPSVGAAPKGR